MVVSCWAVGLRGGVPTRLRAGFAVAAIEGAMEAAAAPFCCG